MDNIQQIKDRVRKLMAYANDGAASEGEIENAMRHAAKLIDAHHLDADELTADAKPAEGPMQMGQAFGTCNYEVGMTWEGTLAMAITELFGCVKSYRTHETSAIRIDGIAQTDRNGKVRLGKKMAFYGPLQESQEAAELFTVWAQSIATMGVHRWGGCYKGDGAMYCLGFVESLYKKAVEVNCARQRIEARPPLLLAGPSGNTAPAEKSITLFQRFDLIKNEARNWLEKTQGIKLSKRSGGSGYRSGTHSAYSEGRAHGAAASFGRSEKRKMLS